jgi:hypothetical protein
MSKLSGIIMLRQRDEAIPNTKGDSERLRAATRERAWQRNAWRALANARGRLIPGDRESEVNVQRSSQCSSCSTRFARP